MSDNSNYIEELIETHGQELVDRQLKLEETMVSDGMATVRRNIQKAREQQNESGTSYGMSLVSFSVDQISSMVDAFTEKARKGGAGRRHIAVKYLVQVDPDVAAFVAMKMVVNTLTGKQHSLQRIAIRIGSQIEDEVRFKKFQEDLKKKEQAGLFKRAQDKASKGGAYHRKHATMAGYERRFGKPDEWVNWPEQDRLHVGMKMIEMIINTGLISVGTKVSSRRDTVKILEPSAKLAAWLEKEVDRSVLLSPVYRPMVVPPQPWTSPFNGGYLTRGRGGVGDRMTMVKTGNKSYLSELAEHVDDMPDVYASINALQETRWAINNKILSVAEELWEGHTEKTPLPSREDIGSVPCPSCGVPLELPKLNQRGGDIHSCLEDPDVLREWKSIAYETHAANVSLRSKRVAAATVLRTAKTYRNDEAIYMPYQLDFRGRVYAIPQFNPQGTDLTKGLLHFADGLPIEDGLAAGWLAVQGANVFGYDKASLEERIEWVEEHEEMILACADNPLGQGWWMTADKPWQFLAFCFEWAGFCEEGYGYVSRIPVALDGSCSGIQHFSAMLRDPVGGAAVNLLPSDLPSDIYQKVCDKVVQKLQIDAGGLSSTIPSDSPTIVITDGETNHEDRIRDQVNTIDYTIVGGPDEECLPRGCSSQEDNTSARAMALGWLSLEPNRKTTKRQVMTLPYGSTRYSCREYTQVWLKERTTKDGYNMPFAKEDMFKATIYMSDLIWDSISEVVVAARAAMDWLQQCARAVAAEDLPVYWRTPVGFPVQQDYKNFTSNRVKTKLGDSIIKLSLRKEEQTIDKRRMANAISPNFVHSLDATHLVMSVVVAIANNIKAFAMIHDSFGTHAANANLLGACLREAFVDLYETFDVLEEFREQILSQCSEDNKDNVPPVPDKADLDIASVRQSDFFFA